MYVPSVRASIRLYTEICRFPHKPRRLDLSGVTCRGSENYLRSPTESSIGDLSQRVGGYSTHTTSMADARHLHDIYLPCTSSIVSSDITCRYSRYMSCSDALKLYLRLYLKNR